MADEKPLITPEFERACDLALEQVGRIPAYPTCDRPIRARDGSDLGFTCNLSKHHLGKCAQMYDGAVLTDQGGDDAK